MAFRWLLLLIPMLALLPAAGSSRAAALDFPTDARGWRMVIPSIGVDSPVEAVGYRQRGNELEWETSGSAVAWHKGTAAPGEVGNAVFSGHNASRGSGVFRSLYRVTVGDRLTIYVGERAFEYEVTERHILRELMAGDRLRRQNAVWAGPFPDERITLVTCHPTWTNTHRLVVVAKPILRNAPSIAPGLVALPGLGAQELSPIPAVWPDVFHTIAPEKLLLAPSGLPAGAPPRSTATGSLSQLTP